MTTSPWLHRLVFWGLVAGASVMPWLASRPPMVDLPQHAAEVALAIDLLRDQSPWAQLFTVHWITPYAVVQVLAMALALLVPVGVALKILLTAAFLGFVLAGIGLRRALGSDERLDWFLVPGFFGYAYQWGFFSYLVAAPIGLGLLWLALEYARRGGRRRALGVVAAGMCLFYSHGMVFSFCVGVAAGFVALEKRSARHLMAASLPFVTLAVAIAGIQLLAGRSGSLLRTVAGVRPEAAVVWAYGPERPATLLLYPWGTGEDWPLIFVGLVTLGVPFAIGSRWQADRRAFVPIAVVIATCALAPDQVGTAAQYYQRLGLFVLPGYALMFARSPKGSGGGLKRPRLATAGLVALPLVCASVLTVQAARAVMFGRESADFESVLRAAAPGRRALSLVFDPASVAANRTHTYLHFPLWYQAEKRGAVDFNFAWFGHHILRYAPGYEPRVGWGFEWAPGTFDWDRHQGRRYDYFMVRRASPLDPAFFANHECTVVLVKAVGTWALYERLACR